MTVSRSLLELSIDLIAAEPLLEMDSESLAEDVVLIAYVWPDEYEFKAAIASVCRAIGQLASKTVSGTKLKYQHDEWLSYHFQHKRAQGGKADMRIIYQMNMDKIRVRGFGHRHLPADISAVPIACQRKYKMDEVTV